MSQKPLLTAWGDDSETTIQVPSATPLSFYRAVSHLHLKAFYTSTLSMQFLIFLSFLSVHGRSKKLWLHSKWSRTSYTPSLLWTTYLISTLAFGNSLPVSMSVSSSSFFSSSSSSASPSSRASASLLAWVHNNPAAFSGGA